MSIKYIKCVANYFKTAFFKIQSITISAVLIFLSTYVSGNGLNFDIVNKGLKLLFEKLNIVSMDIVEYNPLLDKDLECKKKIEILVDTIKNSIK